MTTQDPGDIGIMLTYLIIASSSTTSILVTSSNLAKSASSIQRLHEYAYWDEHEKDFDKPVPAVQNWPKTGSIKISNLSARYRDQLPLVLKDINIDIEEGQKVGIVGRTGSGKSTLLLSLMRILEMARDEAGNTIGSIMIDGQKIDEIGLHHLRKVMAIIPQEPFLLQGTLGLNIDPFGKFKEEEVIEVLRKVGVLDTIKTQDLIEQRVKILKAEKARLDKLNSQTKGAKKTSVTKKPEDGFKKPKEGGDKKIEITTVTGGLTVDPEFRSDELISRLMSEGASEKDIISYNIDIGGSNLSIGQRQLICIGRAIIGSPKILLMDEATANIDQKTDSIIQKVIKEDLRSTTVITIAHRLITIIQYDKLVVLENGLKIEEGSPSELIKSGGLFCSLVSEAGEDAYKKMLLAAEDHNIDPTTLF